MSLADEIRGRKIRIETYPSPGPARGQDTRCCVLGDDGRASSGLRDVMRSVVRIEVAVPGRRHQVRAILTMRDGSIAECDDVQLGTLVETP